MTGLLASLQVGAVEANELLRKALGYLASGGRLTDGEHQTVKGLCPWPIQGWEWDERVHMWKRRDFADVEAVDALKQLLAHPKISGCRPLAAGTELGQLFERAEAAMAAATGEGAPL